MSTVTRLRSWLIPPAFPANDEQTRVAGLLNAILLALIAGFGLLSIFAALLVVEINIWRWVITVPTAVLALVLLFVARRGYVRFASAALSMGLWIITTIAVVIGGGLRTPALSGYLLAVLIAGLLLSWRAALGFATLSVAASTALLYVTLADRLPVPYLDHTPASLWATQVILLLIGTLLLILTRRSIDQAMPGVMVDITERKQAEEEHSKLLHKLHERVKELTALHHAASILQQGGMSTPVLLRDLAALLPPAFQYPEVTVARVRLGDQEATTAGFSDALPILRTDFTTADGAHGSIEVAYTAERPVAAEGPFLAEERQLIESLGDMLRTAYDRIRAEAALRESEVRFRAIFERSAIGIALVDTAAHPIESNLALQTMLGYTADELRAMPFTAFTHPDDAHADAQLFAELAAGRREFYQITKRYIRKDGQVVWGSLRVSLIRDPQGAVQFAIGMVADITERQQAEEALRTYTRRLEDLRDIDQIILTAPSPSEVAEAVIHRLQTLLPCNRAELVLADWETEEAVIVAQVSDRPTSVTVGYRYSLADRLPRPALLEGRIVVEHGLPSDGPASPLLQRLWDEGMRARMLVPLMAQGRLIGTIHLAADRPFTPTEDQRTLARELADHLAIGLQHARLLAEVQAANARLQALSRQLVTAQEDERRRISRELHDEVGQALALVKLNIRAVQRMAGATELAPRLEQSLGVIEDTLLRVRALALDLRPSMLDDLGLLAALRWYVDQQAGLAGLAAEVSAADTLGRLPTEIETVCFRVVQEALTNVVRHAQARNIRVMVEQHDAGVDLCISDDGAGFEASAALARAVQGQSGGLLGMRERVVLCGGRLTIESSAECGTTTRAWIPV
jgi:PAS domain S-box-containing protein